jgi:hypothetical protein
VDLAFPRRGYSDIVSEDHAKLAIVAAICD